MIHVRKDGSLNPVRLPGYMRGDVSRCYAVPFSCKPVDHDAVFWRPVARRDAEIGKAGQILDYPCKFGGDPAIDDRITSLDAHLKIRGLRPKNTFKRRGTRPYREVDPFERLAKGPHSFACVTHNRYGGHGPGDCDLQVDMPGGSIRQ